MDYLEIINSSKSELLYSNYNAIVKGMLETWNRCAQRPQEPDFVVGLTMVTIPMLSKYWSKVLKPNKIDMSLSSVYCHQTPKVNFDGMSKTSCELGDLLIAHFHKNKNGDIFRNAILYQAKVSSQQPYKLKNNEMDQLSLYYSWPEFKYVNSGKGLNGKTRNVLPKMPHTGAQYLLIDDRLPTDAESGYMGIPGTYIVGSCMPSQKLYDHSSFEYELLNFLLLRTGRSFFDIDYPHDDWSNIVWDLLKVGLNKAYKRKHLSGNRTQINDDGASYLSTSSRKATTVVESIIGFENAQFLFNDSNDFPPNFEQGNDNYYDENPGTSIIVIETNASTEE